MHHDYVIHRITASQYVMCGTDTRLVHAIRSYLVEQLSPSGVTSSHYYLKVFS